MAVLPFDLDLVGGLPFDLDLVGALPFDLDLVEGLPFDLEIVVVDLPFDLDLVVVVALPSDLATSSDLASLLVAHSSVQASHLTW